MAKKSCALIGKGTGPRVHVGAPASVQLRGLEEGDRATVKTFCDGGQLKQTHHLNGNGHHLIGDCRFAEVTYHGTNKGFIACILIGV